MKDTNKQLTFMLHKNWNFLYNGKNLKLDQKELDNYRELSLSEDDIKVLMYSFLTKESFYDFNESHGNLNIH
jgi:hypothetical protein